MNCVKRIKRSLMARDFERHVAEIQIRVAVLKCDTTLGMPIKKNPQVRSAW